MVRPNNGCTRHRWRGAANQQFFEKGGTVFRNVVGMSRDAGEA
jgi:hypothetical protein